MELFRSSNIHVEWIDYSNYPCYPQQFEPFEHSVSVVDLILNTGPEAHRYMKSFGR